jgi:hypothetical protein
MQWYNVALEGAPVKRRGALDRKNTYVISFHIVNAARLRGAP